MYQTLAGRSVRTLARGCNCLLLQPPFGRALLYSCVPSRLRERFIAGEDLDSALKIVHRLHSCGFRTTMNLVGTHVSDKAEAYEATNLILESIDRIRNEQCESQVSVKLTCIGLDIEEHYCVDNLRRILEKAARNGIFACIDMEESRYVRQTLEIFSRASSIYGTDALGIAFQSYLIHFRDELQRLIERNSRVRLVRGGYWEPPTAVFSKRSEITEAFRTDVERVMFPGRHATIATHDSAVLALTTRLAHDRGLRRDEFEFQMLLGVRRDLQNELLRQGYQVRIYVPYGKRWQPYLLGCLRRLAGSSIAWNRTRPDDALLLPCSKNSDEAQHHEF